MEDDYDSKNYCKRNGHYCDKSQYGELGFWEKLKMQYHLLFCKSCREYRKKNKRLTKAIEKSGISTLSQEEREELKTHLRHNPTQ
jgi:hypothetical protein